MKGKRIMKNDTSALNDAIGDSLREYNEYNLVKTLDSVPTDDHVPMLNAVNNDSLAEYRIKELHGTVHPFTPVHKKQCQYDDGSLSQAWGIKIGSDHPFKEVGIVREGYTMVENRDLSEIGAEIRDKSGFDWVPVKAWCNGKQFREVYQVEDPNAGVVIPEVGDIVTIVQEMVNSYDSTLRAGMLCYPMVLTCKNGNRSKRFGWEYLFKHNAQSGNWQNEIRIAGEILKNQSKMNLEAFAKACGGLQTIKVNNPQLRDIRQNYIPKLPPQRFAQLMDEFLDKQDFTGWGFLNAGTNVLWHKDKLTNADFNNNRMFVDGIMSYGDDQNGEFIDPNQLELATS